MRIINLLCEFKEEKDEDGNLQVQNYVSMGRLTFWITFGFMIHFWFFTESGGVPATLYDVFYLMVLYNFFKKPLDMMKTGDFKDVFSRRK